MLNRTLMMCLALLLLVTFSPRAQAEPHTFTLHNRTGVDIYKLYLAHHSSQDWDETEDLLDGAVMQNGGEITIHLNKTAPSWDLRVESKSGGHLEWSNVPLNQAEDLILEASGVARVK